MPDCVKTLIAQPGQPMRLDAYLARELAPQYSRSQILRAIRAGLVLMNRQRARAADPIKPGDRIELYPAPKPKPPQAGAAAPPIDVLFEDADLVFVNKPAGMAVHPSPGHPHSTLVDALMGRFPDLASVMELDGTWRAGIVHRLDKDTSGVMVVARNSFSRASLSDQFKNRTVAKIYLALVLGHPPRDRIRIDRPIGRHRTERKRMSVRAPNGREALSDVSVIWRGYMAAPGEPIAVSLVAVRPHTGRTHQIRVHLSSIGHPCLGDPLYGRQERERLPIRRQALHALYLAVSHPRGGQRVAAMAPVAADLALMLAGCGIDAERAGGEILEKKEGALLIT